MASVAKREWEHNGVKKWKWVVRYKDQSGVYRQQTCKSKKEADSYAARVATELEAGSHIAPSQSRTVADAVAAFLEHIDSRVELGSMRPGSRKNYVLAFKGRFDKMFGSRSILDITAADLESWFRATVRGKDMSATTAYDRLSYMKRLWDYGGTSGRRWVRENVAVGAMKAIGRPQKGLIELFDLEGVRRVIVAANDKRFNGRARAHEITRLAVNLAAFCGLRWGEIFGLTLQHINLDKGVLYIRHGLDGYGTLQLPKTRAGIRDVPVPAHIVAMLREFIERWPIRNNSGIVFASQAATPMIASNFRQQAWMPLQIIAGVSRPDGRPLRFHALRHFAVSWMIENGWPITDVSAIVGHANVNITLAVYAHVVKGQKQSAQAMQLLADKLLQAGAERPVLAYLNDARVTQEILEA